MKKALIILALLVSVTVPRAEACVGRILTIGSLDSPADRVFAEMLSVLINERTGTSVNVRVFRNAKELYAAIAAGEIGIFVENTDRTMTVLGRPIEQEAKKAYDLSKEEFRKRLNLVLLSPMGLVTVSGGHGAYFAPVITLDVLENFPALPRVMNKLTGKVNDEEYAQLIRSSQAGDKARQAARDFLKARKLI
jgi:osmoprotectant transport system substrate-binding protein